MDEQEKIERRQHIRLIVTEVLMFLSVILLVGFLTLIVMGYSFNLREIGGSGEVIERYGLVQISSLPSGATITIDGETPLLLNTNASRSMLAGEHEILLSREGFDSWSKKINVTEGMMYRLNYPRLFKTEREPEEIFEFRKGEVELLESIQKYTMEDGVIKSEGVKFVSVSPNNEKMIIQIESNLYEMNMNENKPELRLIEVTGIDGDVVKFTTISRAEWSGNSERMLLKVNGEWAVLNVRNPKETVWLSEVLGKETPVKMQFESEAGDRLLVLDDKKELYELSVRDKKLSEVLLSNVESFDNDGERVVFLTKGKVETEDEETGEKKTEVAFQIRALRVGDEESYLVTVASENASFRTMRYFQEGYIAILEDGKLVIYLKTGWVNSDEDMEKVFEEEVGFEVGDVKKRGRGMAFELLGENGEDKVFDIEAMSLSNVDIKNTGWVDEFLRYRLEDGKLSVLDYDGLNERVLVEKSVASGRTVAISGNNRWLYYFTKDEKDTEKLVREKITN